MFKLPKSLAVVLAGSILLAAAACERDTSSITAPESAAFARKPPIPPSDTQAPTAPEFSVIGKGTGYITLAWLSMDNGSVISYQVKKDGVPLRDGGFPWVYARSHTFTLLEPGTTYTFTAQARDSYINSGTGNLS